MDLARGVGKAAGELKAVPQVDVGLGVCRLCCVEGLLWLG